MEPGARDFQGPITNTAPIRGMKRAAAVTLQITFFSPISFWLLLRKRSAIVSPSPKIRYFELDI